MFAAIQTQFILKTLHNIKTFLKFVAHANGYAGPFQSLSQAEAHFPLGKVMSNKR